MKKVKKEIVFKNNGEEWSAFSLAKKYLEEKGYSCGSMEREKPIGFVKGEDVYISKWTNLGKDVDLLDGFISFTNGTPRNSDAVLNFYEVEND